MPSGGLGADSQINAEGVGEVWRTALGRGRFRTCEAPLSDLIGLHGELLGLHQVWGLFVALFAQLGEVTLNCHSLSIR